MRKCLVAMSSGMALDGMAKAHWECAMKIGGNAIRYEFTSLTEKVKEVSR
jgi:hypothetical protein